MMRHIAWLVLLVGCGEVKSPVADGPPSIVDGRPVDGAPPIDAAATCTTYNGIWQTNAIAFDNQIAPTARVDFETRGDGVTGVTAGTPIPRDEYLACCGIRLDYLGPNGGQLIWAGNASGGFEVRASCPGGLCMATSGVRITFIPTVTAVGIDYPGGDDAAMFGPQNTLIATMSVMGSGTNFIGYESAVRIDHAEFTDGGGENVEKLLYHRCQP
jgi:hypothetical protein